MRILAREAQDIAGFNFDTKVNVDSIILEVDQLSTSMDRMRITIGNFFRLNTEILNKRNIPFVITYERIKSTNTSFVTFDNVKAASRTMDYLFSWYYSIQYPHRNCIL